MKLSIVIPCYNEEKNIPLILERFSEVLSQDKEIEVVLVNNGSTDGSEKVLAELLPKYSFARTVLVSVNQGYGYGILQGLKQAKGNYIGWTHADMQTDPADIVKAYDILEAEGWAKDLYIKGNRKGRSLSEQFFTSGMSIFETIYLKRKLHDVNAQPNIFPREFFEAWQNPPYDFALDLYSLYMATDYGLRIKRFDVLFPPRQFGNSHWNTGIKAKMKFIKRTFDFSINMKKAGIK